MGERYCSLQSRLGLLRSEQWNVGHKLGEVIDQSPLPPQLPGYRTALNDARDFAAKLAVDDKPPQTRLSGPLPLRGKPRDGERRCDI